ncbi:MAG: N-acetylglucosaminyl-diphospho-decaprenol L-rhamnosyltransferase [Psychroserpens sp.]|jgi:N-acetylglucosaminyl-diphospho-decaprenol L-rhamnosyltransferase
MKKVTVSIVSHGHGEMVINLLDQLSNFSQHIQKVIVTHNISDKVHRASNEYPFEIFEVNNFTPLGFGANHNQAFSFCNTDYFCIMNPDIYIVNEPFGQLLSCFQDASVSIAAPVITDLEGNIDDSARYFPTPIRLLKKILFREPGSYKISLGAGIFFPNWVGGMFMLASKAKYEILTGFDEKYFLYYEDVDLCARSWLLNYKVALNTEVIVIHDARRSSHANLKFLRWHVMSAARFFLKYCGRLPISAHK